MPNHDGEILIDTPVSSSNIYLLRTTQQHHVHLTMMVDQKASLLVGVTGICLSVVLGQVSAGNSLITLYVFAAGLLATILLSVMAVAPRILADKNSMNQPSQLGQPWQSSGSGQSGQPSPTTLKNPLFFGHFAQLSFEEYAQDMRQVLDSDGSVYRALTLDIHQMGQVLTRKYRFLKWAYIAFITGLLSTGLTLAIEVLLPLL